MCANMAYSAVGEATRIEYLAPKTCTSKEPTVWFADSVVPGAYGETLAQTSTLAKEAYSYEDGRLIETQETPAGEGCRSRVYGYDEEANRISETTRESSTETCANEGGVVQGHFYDSANRLVDPGVEYEVFGNTTRMPAADAEHEISSSFYVDGQVATERQDENFDRYTYDPAGRTMETVTENEKAKSKTTVVTHYDGPTSELSWSSEGDEKWTRTVAGIDGKLDAVEEAGKKAVLQLHDLQGDIVGTVEDSEAASKLASTYNSTEFGVPQPGTTPPKYAWLGGAGVASEPGDGAGTSTEGGASYVPEVGRALQTAPIASPGSFPDGTGGPGLVYSPVSPGLLNELQELGLQQEAAREEARKREAYNNEGFCEKYPHGSACITPEGNCQVNCLTVIGGGGEGEEEEGSDPEFGDNTHGCRVWASWGNLSEGAASDEVGYGHFECTYASASFELGIELQLIVSGGVEGGAYRLEGIKHNDFGKKESKHGSEKWEFACNPGSWYRLIAWGRYWYSDGYSPWYAYSVDGRAQRCAPEPAPWEPE
jgi:hypothetical protein